MTRAGCWSKFRESKLPLMSPHFLWQLPSSTPQRPGPTSCICRPYHVVYASPSSPKQRFTQPVDKRSERPMSMAESMGTNIYYENKGLLLFQESALGTGVNIISISWSINKWFIENSLCAQDLTQTIKTLTDIKYGLFRETWDMWWEVLSNRVTATTVFPSLALGPRAIYP